MARSCRWSDQHVPELIGIRTEWATPAAGVIFSAMQLEFGVIITRSRSAARARSSAVVPSAARTVRLSECFVPEIASAACCEDVRRKLVG